MNYIHSAVGCFNGQEEDMLRGCVLYKCGCHCTACIHIFACESCRTGVAAVSFKIGMQQQIGNFTVHLFIYMTAGHSFSCVVNRALKQNVLCFQAV